MARHVVAAAADFPPGTRRLVTVNDRAVVVFNVGGEYLGIYNRCPHNGGSLAEGVLTGLLQSAEPGNYSYSRAGEIIRCPWHGWEFDLRTGQSFCRAARARARPLPVQVESGKDIIEGPYKAERVDVRVEDDYVVVHA
ncbi:MAG TPA: Rieske (2Fe-2S) protein [Microvirga sp.]|jgi:3-phenylpropionate/trans-cinnamate dioxygenase ferredoxin subunit|nr:Rieske (2Fe-2S) protein [Microvirga sp.]